MNGDRDGAGGEADAESTGEASGRRDVVVPMELYKTVTVYSTLLAVLFVVLGFMFLDAATLRGSLLLSLVGLLPVTVPALLSPGALSAAFAVVGVSLVGLGAGVYVLGTRFRAAGMGTDKGDEAGDEGNG